MSVLDRFLVVAITMAIATAASPECLIVPVPRGGTLGRGVKKDRIASVIRNEFANRVRNGKSNSAKLESDFLAGIDYTSYLDNVSFMNDGAVTERVRHDLNALSASHDAGNRFLLLLADAYYRAYPADLYLRNPRVGTAASWLARKARIGAFYIDTLAPRYGRDDEGKAIYELIGTYTLFQIASHIDERLATQQLQRSSLKETLVLLQKYSVPVGSPKSDWAKAWDYLRRGDIKKLFSRLDEAFVRHYEAIVGDTYSATRQSLPCRLSMFNIQGRALGSVATAYVLDWNQVRASYLTRSPGGAPLTLPPSTVLAMAASYTSRDGDPYGFTVVNGAVRNAMISRRMDGLVYIHDGVVGAADLRAPIRCGRLTLRPTASLPDYYCLLRCAREAGQSVFQTHLLYGQGRPAFDPSTAPVASGKIERKERRVLALLGGRAVVVDIPIACTLAEATFLLEKTVDLLQIRRTDIQAAINLDTGSYDVLDVFCPTGRAFSHKTRRPKDATNLLVFTAR
jgi:hypothetical protein